MDHSCRKTGYPIGAGNRLQGSERAGYRSVNVTNVFSAAEDSRIATNGMPASSARSGERPAEKAHVIEIVELGRSEAQFFQAMAFAPVVVCGLNL